MTDFEQQRKNMVESQVRPSDVTDRRVIRAMLEVPRETFAPQPFRALAYMDQDVPLGTGAHSTERRVLLAPRLTAKLIQHLELGEDDTVLEVGCGTGYGSAVLSRLARNVVALESDADLAAQAKAKLAEIGAANVDVVAGPLSEGVAARAPFAGILVSGALPSTPPELLNQLLDGGRLTVVETHSGVGRLMQWQRTGSTFGARVIMEAATASLPGFAQQRGFVF